MSEERARILKLLEDGKITADQAARLIEALGARRPDFDAMPPVPPVPPLRGFGRRHVHREVERIPDLVAHAVANALRSDSDSDEEGTDEFAGKRDLLVKSVSGDVEVAGGNAAGITLSYSGPMVKARSHGDEVAVRTISGDVDAKVPAQARVEVGSVSGDVRIEGVEGEKLVKTVSGDVEVSRHAGRVSVTTVSGDVDFDKVSGEFSVETRSGDVDIEPSGAFSGEVATVSGDIALAVPTGADVLITAEIEEDGELELEVESPHEVLEQRERFVKVKFGAGSRVVSLRSSDGDITIGDGKEE